MNVEVLRTPRADPGFLEGGFICIKLLILSVFVLIPHANEIIWSLRQIYFFFIGYFRTLGMEGGSGEPPGSPLDPPLSSNNCYM